MTQKTRSAITSEIASLLADNGTGAITAANLRTVVQDLNDSADITLTDNSLQVGASGTAGSVNVYPTTAANGKLIVSAINNSGAFNSTITNSNIGQATVYSLPDAGAATANIVCDAGAQTISGQKTFVAPVLGAATATSVNKVALTAPASSATLTIADGKTLTCNKTLTLAGTDSTTMTFPSTSATIARTDAANTFTGTQTIGALVATGVTVAPVAVGSTLSATATNAGATFLLNTAGGSVLTLPAATGTGNVYRCVVSVSTTSAAHKILAASGSDFIIGKACGSNAAGATLQFSSPAATNHSIQMPNAGSQPSGGIIGDIFIFTDVGANLWHCVGQYEAGTTATTPFSAATS